MRKEHVPLRGPGPQFFETASERIAHARRMLLLTVLRYSLTLTPELRCAPRGPPSARVTAKMRSLIGAFSMEKDV